MKLKDVNTLPAGFYRIHWKQGGSSLAAVGNNRNGVRWLAPVNWVHVSSDDATKVWRLVAKATRITNFRYFTSK